MTGVRCIAFVHLEDISIVREEPRRRYQLCDNGGMVHGFFNPNTCTLQTGPVATIEMSQSATNRFENRLRRDYDIIPVDEDGNHRERDAGSDCSPNRLGGQE